MKVIGRGGCWLAFADSDEPMRETYFPYGFSQLAVQRPSAQPNPDATDHVNREK
jgi:hypothetical protein